MTDDAIFSAVYDADVEGRARDLWRAALDALAGQGGARAERVTAALEAQGGGDRAVVVVAEYLSAMAAPGDGLGGLRDTIAEARSATRNVDRLARQLRAASQALRYAQEHDGGDDVSGDLSVAAGAMEEAARAMALAAECLDRAGESIPRDGRGRGGTVGKLAVAADVAFATQLGRVWRVCGLSLAGGRSGDGIDEVVAHIVEASDPRRSPSGSRKWLEAVVTAAREAMSTENRPRK